jgi:hypothetical protein
MSEIIPAVTIKTKITSQELLAALRKKFDTAAVLSEVTMTDEEESHRVRSAYAMKSAYYKRLFKKRGQSFDLTMILPEGYDTSKAILTRRIDALIFESQQITAVEIKISRSDFFRDTLEKRSAWVKHTNRFAYLTPKGLVKSEEVPEGCALWEYENGIITIVKRSKINKESTDFPQSMVKYFAWRAFSAENKLGYKRR